MTEVYRLLVERLAAGKRFYLPYWYEDEDLREIVGSFGDLLAALGVDAGAVLAGDNGAISEAWNRLAALVDEEAERVGTYTAEFESLEPDPPYLRTDLYRDPATSTYILVYEYMVTEEDGAVGIIAFRSPDEARVEVEDMRKAWATEVTDTYGHVVPEAEKEAREILKEAAEFA